MPLRPSTAEEARCKAWTCCVAHVCHASQACAGSRRGISGRMQWQREGVPGMPRRVVDFSPPSPLAPTGFDGGLGLAAGSPLGRMLPVAR
jgi:hypothetical protein